MGINLSIMKKSIKKALLIYLAYTLIAFAIEVGVVTGFLEMITTPLDAESLILIGIICLPVAMVIAIPMVFIELFQDHKKQVEFQKNIAVGDKVSLKGLFAVVKSKEEDLFMVEVQVTKELLGKINKK